MDYHHTLEAPSGIFSASMRRKFLHRRWMWLAAVLLFLLSFALWQWFGTNMTEIRTNAEKRTQVTLPDHTEVLLNTGTTFRYRKLFNDYARREVWLNGDAVFQVPEQEVNTGHQARPFIVHTAGMDITGAGSSFRVTAHRRTTRVSLEAGSLHIHFKDKKLADRRLEPGQTLIYNGKDQPQVQ
ncbi:FecR family protein [Chitinophaga japonensis]|uniref:FecR family protein n=1 Tax=Chitinophaga japonensis TaxID=104662 RepID=A0A562SL73_CHIJA|nr:FecR domain-containing protein [Chitinophaga japonensis]TWI82051.1 FecR family protein [Chitinophaga japonensis]